MQATLPRARVNHDTGLLGVIAVICMIFDHVGAQFFPQAGWMRIVGRIAFPLFAWGIAIGAEHTRNYMRYALRLLLLLAVSQPFYMYGLNHTIQQLNIFATLFLGLIAIWGIKERQEWMTVVALLLSNFITMDYGFRGVLCILLLWACRNSPLALSLCFSTFCVLWGQNSREVWATPYFILRLQTCAILALPLMLFPRIKRTPTPRWLMYAVYPGHLAVIWAIKALMR